MSVKLHLPSPGTILALVALVAAFGGSAWAAGKIGSRDIKREAVRSKHVRDGGVKPRDLDVVRLVRTQGVAATGDSDSVPLRAVARAAVVARRGEVIRYHAMVEGRRAAGSDLPCEVRIAPEGPVELSSFRVATFASSAFTERWMRHDEPTGGSNPASALARELPVIVPGRYEISLVLNPLAFGNRCEVRERALWIEVLG